MAIDFPAEGAALLPDLVELRRTLHQIPELGNELPLTQSEVLSALDGLPLEITLGRSVSSITAVLRGGKPGPVVLLRGDMDALPLHEESGEEFASANGRMHACGHDLHTAGLVGAARLLAAHRDELPGSIVFMFQPGEESPGGAQPMIAEGLLDAAGDRPIAAYGIHVGPGPLGEFATRPGTMLAGVNDLHVVFRGVGGHGSAPHLAQDPVPAALEFGTAIQSLVTRRFSVFDPVVATVTQLQAGTAVNIIPDTATVGATVRTLSKDSTARFGPLVTELAEGIAAAHGVSAEVDWVEHYPVTVNDDAEADFALRTLSAEFGAARVITAPDPLMGSEDFSFVLEEVPGCFLFLRCTPADTDLETAPNNHSAHIRFDDSVLGDQAAALAQLAYERLRAG